MGLFYTISYSELSTIICLHNYLEEVVVCVCYYGKIIYSMSYLLLSFSEVLVYDTLPSSECCLLL